MKENEVTLNHFTSCYSVEHRFRYESYDNHESYGILQKPYYEWRNNNLRLVINSENVKKLPDQFRKTTDYAKLKANKDMNFNGLSNLYASASSQFSEYGLILIKQSIGSAVPIIIVDLRQESHGFINGIAISWIDNHNKANKGFTRKEVLSDEITRLRRILLNKPIYISNKTLIPEEIQNEKSITESYGMSYMRIPVTDNEMPNNHMIDYFIKFVNSLLPKTWLHFHCKAGLGRTTTFIVMYDMMKNAKKVSLHQIINRQVLLGGKNLLRVEEFTRDGSGRRGKFIKRFYEYCVENNDNFKTTWSQWMTQHRN